LEEYSLWEDWLGGEPSTLSLSITPDALSSGHDEPISFMPTPEKNWDFSLHSPLEYAALQPGLDFTTDVNPVSDYELSNCHHSSLSSFDEPNMVNNPTPSNARTFILERQDSVLADQFGLVVPQQRPSSNSSLIPLFQGPIISYPPLVFSSPEDQPPPISHGLSQVPLSRLPGLKCPQCQQNCADKRQLSRHLRQHETFACDIEGCDAVVKELRTLERHKMSVHEDLFPGPKFACECGYETPRKDHYLRHKETCQGGKKRKR